MTLPEEWLVILQAPVFIISVDEERYTICEKRVRRAGFTNIQKAEGVRRDVQEEIEAHWATHDFPSHRRPFGQHPAAVMLAHLNLWKHIQAQNISYAVIFEDDTLFHTHWHELAPQYYQATPKHTDMIFMGHHCGNVYPTMHIVQVPVYCLNAYIITQDGTRKLYEMITKYPVDDCFGVIDMMLVNLQTHILHTNQNPLQYSWYVWNTEMFPDPDNEPFKCQHALAKDKGLVFQQQPFFALEADIADMR